MKIIHIVFSLLLITGMQNISVNAIEENQTNHIYNSQVEKNASHNNYINGDLKEEVSILNKNENADNEKYKKIKNAVYTELSDYMKMKYKLYDIYFVEAINDISMYQSESLRTLGLINHKSNYIIISNNTDNNKRTVKHTLFHELGHALDLCIETDNLTYRTLSKYSDTKEFQDIFYDERYNLQRLAKEYYFTDYISEYFADCYAIYMENPIKMKENAPRTYDFIDSVSNKKI